MRNDTGEKRVYSEVDQSEPRRAGMSCCRLQGGPGSLGLMVRGDLFQEHLQIWESEESKGTAKEVLRSRMDQFSYLEILEFQGLRASKSTK